MYRCPLEIQLFCLEGQLKCESKNVPLCNDTYHFDGWSFNWSLYEFYLNCQKSLKS